MKDLFVLIILVGIFLFSCENCLHLKNDDYNSSSKFSNYESNHNYSSGYESKDYDFDDFDTNNYDGVDAVADFKKAKLSLINDADTFEVNIDGSSTEVKLIGVGTPKLHNSNNVPDYLFKETVNCIVEKLNGSREIYIEKDLPDDKGYQLTYRYIWTTLPKHPYNPTYEEFQNQCLNAYLVRQGYAKVSKSIPYVKYSDWLVQLETSARIANKGVWNETERVKWENENNQQQAVSESQEVNTTQVKWVQTTEEITNRGKTYIADTTQGPIKGNKNSKVYHVQGQNSYNKISVNNVIWFNTVAEAEAAGYRPAER